MRIVRAAELVRVHALEPDGGEKVNALGKPNEQKGLRQREVEQIAGENLGESGGFYVCRMGKIGTKITRLQGVDDGGRQEEGSDNPKRLEQAIYALPRGRLPPPPSRPRINV